MLFALNMKNLPNDIPDELMRAIIQRADDEVIKRATILNYKAQLKYHHN
ncbi:hypothetical protein NBRC116600_29530 [Thalassotalea sp. SU-HH00458]